MPQAPSQDALAYWAAFTSAHPEVDEGRLYEVFHFGDSQPLADALAALVLAGRKRATASSLWTFEAEGRRPPRTGDLSIVTDWSGRPLCIVETARVDIRPFHAVDAQFAADEGEGDGSIDDWRSNHARYFERECARLGRPFSNDMPVVCERFTLSHARPAFDATQQLPVLPKPAELSTERLTLRTWRDSDREAFAALNADPEVMEFFPSTVSRAASDASIDRWQTQFAERGWSNWAVEIKATGRFIGFVGLSVPARVLPFTPCVEIGWRLARSAWGRGYATEAAQAALRFGFETLELDEIVSFTALVNTRSRSVMERIGMRRDDAADFEHPAVPEGSPLQRHCLYRLSRKQWKAAPVRA